MSAETSPAASKRIAGVEVRSIDYVPLNERHGKVWSQGPLWFMSNAQIATLAVGTFSVTGGGNLIWSILAIISGVLFGTFFMAFHSAQGPQLGLPQMIQSRPQFGYVGALLVWAFAYLQYAGFNIFNTILAGDALHSTVHGPTKLWIVVATLVAAIVALVGYDLIHGVERWLTAGFLVIFGLLTIGVCTLNFPPGSFDLGGFKWTPFLIQFGAVAGYQISWAIYVSDYSRYLPPSVTVRKTFLWTYWGSALGAIWLMCLGSALAAWAGAEFDTIASLKAAGDHLFTGFGGIALIFSTLGLISVTALNMYGGSLTLISAIDSFKKVRPTSTLRIITISFTAVLSLIPALLIGENFLTNFEDFSCSCCICSSPGPRSTSSTTTWCDVGITPSPRSSIPEACTGGGAGVGSRRISSGSRRCFRSCPPASTPGLSRPSSMGRTSRCSSAFRSRGSFTGCWPRRSTWRARRGSPRRRPTSWSGWPLLTGVPRRTEAV